MIRWINNLKGFGILLVVLGHILPRDSFGQWIYAFHVPLFFYLSGYLFSIRPTVRWGGVISHSQRLLLPFYFWSFICLLVNYIVVGIWYPEKIHTLLIYTAHVALGSGQNGIKELGLSIFPIWFIPPLFFSNLLFVYTKRFVVTKMGKASILISLTLLGISLFHISRTLPYRIDVTLISIPFVLAGYCHNKIIGRFNNKSVGFILVLIGTFINSLNLYISDIHSVELVLQITGNSFMFLISAISLSMGMFALFENIFRESTIGEFFGKNSMPVMAFHIPVIYFLGKIPFIDLPSRFLLTCIILYILVLLVDKYIPWSFNFKLLQK